MSIHAHRQSLKDKLTKAGVEIPVDTITTDLEKWVAAIPQTLAKPIRRVAKKAEKFDR